MRVLRPEYYYSTVSSSYVQHILLIFCVVDLCSTSKQAQQVTSTTLWPPRLFTQHMHTTLSNDGRNRTCMDCFESAGVELCGNPAPPRPASLTCGRRAAVSCLRLPGGAAAHSAM